MRQKIQLLCASIVVVLLSGCTDTTMFQDLKGPYLGQKAPGSSPEVFAPGIISHGFHELSITFSPSGDEIFYIMSDRGYSHYSLITMRMVDGNWVKPSIASFSHGLNIYSVCIHPVGETLYFAGRPAGLASDQTPFHDIYRVSKIDGIWGKAEKLEGPINSDLVESSVSVAEDYTLFFQRSAKGEPGDLWMSEFDGSSYLEPVRLPSPVNTQHSESRPFIAPDKRYLIFQSNRPGTLGSMDLFVCYALDDEWGIPVNLGSTVNGGASDFGPSVSPDGQFLFFSSYRADANIPYTGKTYEQLIRLYRQPQNGYATLYWMSSGIIHEMLSMESKGR